MQRHSNLLFNKKIKLHHPRLFKEQKATKYSHSWFLFMLKGLKDHLALFQMQIFSSEEFFNCQRG